MQIANTQLEQFQTLGYTIVPDAIDLGTLQILREECAYFVGYIDGSMKARGRETYGITHRLRPSQIPLADFSPPLQG